MADTIELADGRRFGLATYGAAGGFPVLALHGAPASRLMFDVADGPAQALGLRLYCPDRPGYGLTPKDNEPTLEKRAGDLVAIADALLLGRFAVLGVSGGAPYAVALAERLGDRICGLGLVSPMGPVAQFEAAKSAGKPGEVLKRLSRGHRIFFLDLPRHRTALALQAGISARVFKAAPHLFARLFAHSLSSADSRILQKPHVQESLIAMTLEALRQGADGGLSDLEIFSQPWPVAFEAIRAQTIIWQGTADRIVPEAVSLWLSGLIPNCRFVRLEDCGHFWVYDHVDEVLGALGEIAQIAARAADAAD
ncbi:MAG: alpha/beta hydrolase [Alphaproteobacteria bacterium]|nr:alpha/beta hydrolase [Alphaproteobacteria bacterium]